MPSASRILRLRLGPAAACSALLLPLAARPLFSFEEYTSKQLKSMERATAWILKAQNKDGSWGLDAKSTGDLTCTALAGMALLAGGTTERDGERPELIKALRDAVDYILGQAKKAKNDIALGQTTLIQGKLGTTVHNHFAVVFLTQAYGMRSQGLSDDTHLEMKAAIQKLTDYIARTQESDGSWHKETFGSLKATCMAWLALRSAASIGIRIDTAKVEKTLKFIQKQYNAGAKLFQNGNQDGGYGDYQTLYATASSVRVLQGMGLGGEAMSLNAIDTFIQNVSSGQWKGMYLTVEGEDYLSAMMFSHTLIGENGVRWKKWFPYIRDALIARQSQDGSWTTTACISGRTFATACALLSLQTPNRLLPIQD